MTLQLLTVSCYDEERVSLLQRAPGGLLIPSFIKYPKTKILPSAHTESKFSLRHIVNSDIKDRIKKVKYKAVVSLRAESSRKAT